jgi:hypothetical protein
MGLKTLYAHTLVVSILLNIGYLELLRLPCHYHKYLKVILEADLNIAKYMTILFRFIVKLRPILLCTIKAYFDARRMWIEFVSVGMKAYPHFKFKDAHQDPKKIITSQHVIPKRKESLRRVCETLLNNSILSC